MTSYFYEITECPKCSGKFALMGLGSSNTFGATFYTDGFVGGTAYGSAVISCPCCNAYLWSGDLKTIEFIPESKFNNSIKDKYHIAYSGDISYQEVLDSGSYNNDEQEKYLRRWIWWSANNDFRDCETKTFSPSVEYQQNLDRLLQLNRPERYTNEIEIWLDLKRKPELYFIEIEILRELSRFEEAVALADLCITIMEVDLKKYIQSYKESSSDLNDFEKRKRDECESIIKTCNELKSLAVDGSNVVKKRVCHNEDI